MSDKIVVTKKVEVAVNTAKLTLRWGDPTASLTPFQRYWLLLESKTDSINKDLDVTRVDVTALDPRIKPESVMRTTDEKQLYCAPYITPYV